MLDDRFLLRYARMRNRPGYFKYRVLDTRCEHPAGVIKLPDGQTFEYPARVHQGLLDMGAPRRCGPRRAFNTECLARTVEQVKAHALIELGRFLALKTPS